MSLSFRQQWFVDVCVSHSKVIKCMSSPEEYKFMPILKTIGKQGKDWFHQPAYIDEGRGLVAVPDFAFPKEKLIIELDGSSHRGRKQRERDIERDRVFRSNEFYVIRIPVPIEKEKESYWRVFIIESLKIAKEELKKKPKKKKLFSDKAFNKALKRKLKYI